MRRNGINTSTILLIVLLLLSRLRYSMSDPASFFLDILITLPGIIIGISFHEFGHAFVAYKLGDETPKRQGRVTLNPAAHIDLIGLFCLIFAGFGWGRPVQISLNAYQHPRRDRLFVSVAGVIMNFIIALILAVVTRFALPSLIGSYGTTSASGIILDILLQAIAINIVLMLFNLLPVPPLDGFNIITEIFNLRESGWYQKFYSFGGIILLVLIVFNLTSYILTPAVNGIYSFILNNIILS